MTRLNRAFVPAFGLIAISLSGVAVAAEPEPLTATIGDKPMVQGAVDGPQSLAHRKAPAQKPGARAAAGPKGKGKDRKSGAKRPGQAKPAAKGQGARPKPRAAQSGPKLESKPRAQQGRGPVAQGRAGPRTQVQAPPQGAGARAEAPGRRGPAADKPGVRRGPPAGKPGVRRGPHHVGKGPPGADKPHGPGSVRPGPDRGPGAHQPGPGRDDGSIQDRPQRGPDATRPGGPRPSGPHAGGPRAGGPRAGGPRGGMHQPQTDFGDTDFGDSDFGDTYVTNHYYGNERQSPGYARQHRPAPPPEPKLSREGQFSIGLTGGLLSQSGSDDPTTADVGVGIAARYRLADPIGAELMWTHYQSDWQAASEATVNPLQASAQFFLAPDSRMTPYLSVGYSWLGESTSAEGESTRVAGPHAGAGLELNLGEHAALGADLRYIHIPEALPEAAAIPGALQANAGLNFYF